MPHKISGQTTQTLACLKARAMSKTLTTISGTFIAAFGFCAGWAADPRIWARSVEGANNTSTILKVNI